MSRVLVMSVGADAIDARAIVDGHVDRVGSLVAVDGRFDPDSLRAVVRDVVWHGVDIAGVAHLPGPVAAVGVDAAAAGAGAAACDGDPGIPQARLGWVARMLRQQLPLTPVLVRGETGRGATAGRSGELNPWPGGIRVDSRPVTVFSAFTPFDSAPADIAFRLVVAVLAALLVSVGVRLAARGPARRSPVVADMSRRGRRPLRLALVLLAVWLVLDQHWLDLGGYRGVVTGATRVVGLALIGVLAWLVAVLAFVAEDLLLARYRLDVEDNWRARRVRTQVSLLRRLTVVVVAVVAVASMLLTFRGAQAAGASLFASAGLLSVVAGLAAQTSLANVFAGLQLAFTDGLRVDDVVVVQQQWGRVEEITLTYVVVHIWDDRRLVLPSTYFTTTPFESWTRQHSDLLGVVDFDLDWTAPFDAMRAELRRILAETDLWDTRVGILQVTDAVASFVHVRVLVSGRDGPTVFDLRCHVRESLVRWLQREHPYALPVVRHEPAAGRPARPPIRRAPRAGSPRRRRRWSRGCSRPSRVPSVSARSPGTRSRPRTTAPGSPSRSWPRWTGWTGRCCRRRRGPRSSRAERGRSGGRHTGYLPVPVTPAHL